MTISAVFGHQIVEKVSNLEGFGIEALKLENPKIRKPQN